MKWLVFISLCLIPLFLNAQDHGLITKSADGDYYQTEKLRLYVYKEPILGEIWLTRNNEGIYLNLTMRDTAKGVNFKCLGPEYNELNFSLSDTTQISYSLEVNMHSNIIQVPLIEYTSEGKMQCWNFYARENFVPETIINKLQAVTIRSITWYKQEEPNRVKQISSDVFSNNMMETYVDFMMSKKTEWLKLHEALKQMIALNK